MKRAMLQGFVVEPAVTCVEYNATFQQPHLHQPGGTHLSLLESGDPPTLNGPEDVLRT